MQQKKIKLIADYIRAETRDGYLEDWAESEVLMTEEQKQHYFDTLGKHILKIVNRKEE